MSKRIRNHAKRIKHGLTLALIPGHYVLVRQVAPEKWQLDALCTAEQMADVGMHVAQQGMEHHAASLTPSSTEGDSREDA